MRAEINKQVELVQVLLFLSEQQDKTFQCLNNKRYVDSITQWFSPFKNHLVVQLTKDRIINDHFVHIKPISSILMLGSIIADPAHELFEWASAVNNFITDTDFDGFFEQEQNYYRWIEDNIRECDLDKWTDFIENYFKQKPDEFHLIISPIIGNYGFSLDQNGKQVAYTVRFMPKYDKNGDHSFEFDYFAKGIAHEYAHCFVNPTVEKHLDILKKHKAFFDKHKIIPNFYNTDYAIINEYFVRAFQIRFMETKISEFPNFDMQKEYSFQKETFIFIDEFIKALREFEALNVDFSKFYLDNIDKLLEVC